jgi:group I intron endonuclease
MGYIYMLTSPSGKSYIGQTFRPIEKRLEEHQKERSNCVAIYRAIRKHGWGNFDKVWYECPDEDLNKHEELMVDVLGTLSPGGYNLREGGGNNGKPSEESKQRMSKAHFGKTHTEKTKQKMGDYRLGKTLSDGHKQNISEAKQGEKHHMFGKPHTKESKQKMSESHRGEKNPDSKRVYQYDLEGKLIGSFASSGEAGRHLKKDGSFIRRCAREKCESAYNFKWVYV